MVWEPYWANQIYLPSLIMNLFTVAFGLILVGFGLFLFLIQFKKDSGDPHKQRRTLQGKYSTHQGGIAAWWQSLLSGYRTKTAAMLTEETDAAITLQQREAVLEQIEYDSSQRPILRKQAERERDASHQVSLNIAQYAGELAKHGYTLETDQQIKLREADSRIKQNETEKIHRLEETHRKILDYQEVEKTNLLKMDELRRVFILKHFSEHQQLAMIQTALDDNYRDIARLEKDKEPGWEYMVADRKENIVTLKENQNGIRARLLGTPSQEKLGGTDPNTDRPRDPR